MIGVNQSCLLDPHGIGRVMKVIVAGEGGIGKTSLVKTCCDGRASTTSKLTIGIKVHVKSLQVDGKPVHVSIWDFGGQEQFRFILDSFLGGARAGLACFSLERFQSFVSIDEWIKLLRSRDPALPILLVGTKSDLEDDQVCKVHDDDIRKVIETHALSGYIRTSSHSGEGTGNLLDVLVSLTMS
ncbi:GTP-binding protein [Candidatus Bathyarchaeota archaeon]|nr:GTP-binding protein [Candidatus Bathyarchaeota archaeon]